MSETPETQKAVLESNGQWSFVLKECCERLERERDEARESTLRIDVLNFKLRKELDDAKSKIKSQADRIRYLEGATNHAKGTPLSVALRERDEARESLKHISEYGTEEINAAVELRQKLATALVERDEAREELHDIRLNLGEDADGYTLLHAVCVLQNERNEAMEDSLEQARLLGMGSEREAKLISDLEFRRGLYKVQEQYLETARRERDEAREKAERYRIEANAIMMQRDEWAAMCGRYKQERDESQEKYATEATEHMLAVNKLFNERDDARNKIADALQEVDLRTLDFERMKQERDNAMEALMKIEDLFIDGTDIYADRESMGLIAREALGETK